MKRNRTGLVIENASVVVPDGILENASLRVVGGIIAEVSPGYVDGRVPRLDLHGLYVLPGLIDLHSDAIEKEVEPRPNANFPVNMAIIDLDKKLAACGITTMYHSVSFSENEIGVRENAFVSNAVREVNRLAPRLGVRTRIHARFEISSKTSTPFIEQLIDDGCIHLFSIMDHTPGQGQFKDVANYLKYYTNRNEFKDTSFAQKVIDEKRKAAVTLQADHISQLVDRCHARGIPVASHDDDTREKLDTIEKMGIQFTEFPINMETAVMAAERGFHICYGSPNVVRGSSTSNNLSARAAILAGVGDILCSDYAPMSLIHAVYTLERSGLALHRAVNMASLNPARAAGISDFTGSLEPGKSADFIVVDPSGEVPRVLKTFVGGKEVYSSWRSPEERTCSIKEGISSET